MADFKLSSSSEAGSNVNDWRRWWSGQRQVRGGACFERLGCLRIEADRIGHEVLEEPLVRQALRDRWGAEVFTDGGAVDRAAVARRVFDARGRDSDELQFLERVTHPRIEARLARQLKQLQVQETKEVAGIVLDAALLFEAGWHRWCDHLVYIEVAREVRLQRALSRGWTAAQFAAREAAQWPLPDKRGRTDSMIDNSGTLEQTFQQVQSVWESLTGRSSRIPSV